MVEAGDPRSDGRGEVTRSLLAFVLGPFVLACAPSSQETVVERRAPVCITGTYRVILDAKLEPAWKEASRKSIRAWAARIGAALDVEEGDASAERYADCAIVVLAGEKEHLASAPSYRNPDGTLAAGTIYLSSAPLSDEAREATILHEMGHLVGLDHDLSKEHESVMWPYIQTPPRIGCEDWRRACAIWRCEAACQGGGWLP